jgi:hypothetical protein
MCAGLITYQGRDKDARLSLLGCRELRENISFTEIIFAASSADGKLLRKSGADVKFLLYVVVTGLFVRSAPNAKLRYQHVVVVDAVDVMHIVFGGDRNPFQLFADFDG